MDGLSGGMSGGEEKNQYSSVILQQKTCYFLSRFFFTPSLKHLFICNIPPKGTEFNIRLFSHCLGCELFFFF